MEIRNFKNFTGSVTAVVGLVDTNGFSNNKSEKNRLSRWNVTNLLDYFLPYSGSRKSEIDGENLIWMADGRCDFEGISVAHLPKFNSMVQNI